MSQQPISNEQLDAILKCLSDEALEVLLFCWKRSSGQPYFHLADDGVIISQADALSSFGLLVRSPTMPDSLTRYPQVFSFGFTARGWALMKYWIQESDTK